MSTSLLVIEDYEPIRFGITEYFRARGFDVESAGGVEAAVTLLDARSWDLVITDLRLSDGCEVDGLDIISTIHERTPATRIILLTAYGSPAVEAAAFHLGAHLFLLKPIRMGDLEQAARGLLAQAAA